MSSRPPRRIQHRNEGKRERPRGPEDPLVAHLPQLFHENVTCSHRLQQRQPPIATERNKMQMTFAVAALQSGWHRKPHGKKRQPQDPGSKNEAGAPSVSLYLPEKCRTDILSMICMGTNTNFSSPGHPPTSGT